MNRLGKAALVFSVGMGFSTIIPILPLIGGLVWAILILCAPPKRVAPPAGIVYPPADPNTVPVVGTYERAVGRGQYTFPEVNNGGGKYRLTR